MGKKQELMEEFEKEQWETIQEMIAYEEMMMGDIYGEVQSQAKAN